MKPRTSGLGTVFAALVLLLGSAACSSSPKSTSSSPDTAITSTPRAGGSLTLVQPVESRGLDPAVATIGAIGDGTRLAAIFDVLVYLDPATDQVRPQLAQSLTPEAGGGRWVLRLRPGVRFTDGTPLDAEAVRFNWARHADPATRSLQASAARGLRLEVTDPLTLVITPPNPNQQLDKVIANNLAHIGSPTAIRRDSVGFAQHPVGAGPFVLRQWRHDDRMIMARNDRYWQPGRPYLDELVIRVVSDQQQRVNAMTTNEVQAAVMSDPIGVADAGRRGLPASQVRVGGGQMVMFNTSRPPFDDVRARRALALALDSADMVRVLLGDATAAVDSLFATGTPYRDESVHQPSADPAEAQRLLDQLAAEGTPLKFTYTTLQQPSARKAAEYLQSRLSTMRGVSMDIEFLDGPGYQEKTQVQKSFQAATFSAPFADPEPLVHNLLRSDGSENRMSYASPEVDRALDAARAAADPQARRQAYVQVQRLVAQDVPFWLFQATAGAVVHRKDVAGVVQFGDGMVLPDRIGLAA